MPQHGKKYRKSEENIELNKLYSLEDAVAKIPEIAYAAFDETVDIAVNLGVNPRHADQMVRGACILPNGTGKSVRVLVFAQGEKVQEALDAGADYAGLDEYIEKIQKEGWLDFEKVVAIPNVMGKVGRLGKILGPRGLMPNPKVGTVTRDVARAVKEAKAGKIEFRVDKNGLIHSRVGKKGFSAKAIVENILAIVETLLKLRPSSSKGTYMKKITLSTTMSPGVKVDPQNVIALLKG